MFATLQPPEIQAGTPDQSPKKPPKSAQKKEKAAKLLLAIVSSKYFRGYLAW